MWGHTRDIEIHSAGSGTVTGEANCFEQGRSELVSRGDIEADPGFVGRHDFHLRPDSPCRDGAAWSPLRPPADIDGVPRPASGPTAPGAYEASRGNQGTAGQPAKGRP